MNCHHCRATLEERAIDREREIATCQACGRLVDVRAQSQQVPGSQQALGRGEPKPRARAPVQLPPGMMLGTHLASGGIELRRPWLRGKHWLFLLVCLLASVVVARFWLADGPSAWLVVGTLFVLNWDFMVLAMFVNLTTVRADGAGVQVRHGPLPSLFGRNVTLARQQVKQLFAARHGAAFAVRAELVDGNTATLVAPLVSPEQALFVEQQLEKVLGLVDFAVEGELGSVPGDLKVEGAPLKGARSGAAAALLVPLLLIGVLGLFFLMASTTVEGSLQGTGKLPNFALTPDDCVSGQREGFGGVVLTGESGAGLALRIVSDPIQGTVLVLVQPGRENTVIEKSSCTTFDVQTVRSNTSINGIWAVDGHATIECADLRGRVKFEGCH